MWEIFHKGMAAIIKQEGGGQSMAKFIAILGLVPLSSGFSFIVGLVLNIEGEFVPYIVGVTLVVQNFSEIFCIDFVVYLEVNVF